VITRPSFDEQLPKLIPALLLLYKKEKEMVNVLVLSCALTGMHR
jgi:hypothetical protein